MLITDLPYDVRYKIYMDYFSPEARLRQWFREKASRELDMSIPRLSCAVSLLQQLTNFQEVGCEVFEEIYNSIIVQGKRNFRRFTIEEDVIVSTLMFLWH